MITLTEIADIIESEEINLRIFDDKCARSQPNKRIIYIPIDFFSIEQREDITISLLHEIEHIRHTTYDLDKLDLSEEEFSVYNCIEDIRIDTAVMKQYSMRELYKSNFLRAFKKKHVKGTLVQRLSWLALLQVLDLRTFTVTTRRREAYLLGKLYLPSRFRMTAVLLARLEDKPTSANFKQAEEAIKMIIKAIKATTDKESEK